jgi:hypothetical protein
VKPTSSTNLPFVVADLKAGIEAALTRNRWRPAETARDLGISRTSLWKRMKELGIPLTRRGPGPKKRAARKPGQPTADDAARVRGRT